MLVRSLMEQSIKADVSKEATSTIKLLKVDISKQSNYKETTKINVGFVRENLLRQILVCDYEIAIGISTICEE